MSRLIDANILEKILLKLSSENMDIGLPQMASGINTAICQLQAVPTINAIKVVHSYWTTKRTTYHDGELYCARCGQEAGSEYGRYTYVKSDFCPNCGAKMDGKEEE